MHEPLITFADAAKLVGPGVTARTLRTWHEKKVLRAIKVGRSWRTTESAIWEAIEKLWQSSSYTGLIPATVQGLSRGFADTSGTSPGTKVESEESAARALSEATRRLQKKRSRDLPSLGMTRMTDGKVIPYNRVK